MRHLFVRPKVDDFKNMTSDLKITPKLKTRHWLTMTLLFLVKAPAWIASNQNLRMIVYTGCLVMIVFKFQLHTRARKQPITWQRCPFVHYYMTFWYLVSIKFRTHLVITCLWNCENMQNTFKIKEEIMASNVLQISPQRKLRSS